MNTVKLPTSRQAPRTDLSLWAVKDFSCLICLKLISNGSKGLACRAKFRLQPNLLLAASLVVHSNRALTNFRAKERLRAHARSLGFENFLEKKKYMYLYI